MATIQFLAGNPKKGSAKKSKAVKKVAKKASKKAPSAAQLKARANFVKMVRAKAKASKSSKKAAPKKKAVKKVIKKKRNPQRFMFVKDKKEQAGIWFPTVAERVRSEKALKNTAKKVKGASPAKSREYLAKIKVLQANVEKEKAKVREGLAEKKALLAKDYIQFDHETKKEADQEAYEKSVIKSRKGSEDIKKAKFAKKAAKKGIRRKKIKAAKKAKQTKQGVSPVAKKKAKKKSSKKVAKKVSPKKAVKKASPKRAKKASRKPSKKRSKKRGSKTFTLIGKGKIKSNPSIAGITGQSDNMAVAGLAIGGFSYNLFNDLGKRYLPASVMNVIAMAGPVSGAVIPSAVAGAILLLASKYPKNKALEKAAGIAKGVIASAVVIAGASVYQVVAQPMVKKAIGLNGYDEADMLGYDDMSGQADSEFSGQSDSEFSGQADLEFAGDDEFGEDEF